MKKKWFRIALLNLVVAASMGVLLRFAFVQEVSWMKFRYFLHGHSHVAMLGWIYLALFALMVHTFVPHDPLVLRRYNRLFWMTQVSVIGMLVSFPIQGYKSLSISFSTLHILLSYTFTAFIWKELKKVDTFSGKWIRTAFVFMIVSTLGLWFMGPIMASKLKGSAIYYMAVQFYLHFQFNGWFLFSILGLFFHHVEKNNITLSRRSQSWFFYLFVASCLLTFALAVAWSKPLAIVFAINSLGVGIQLMALILFLVMIWPLRNTIANSFSKLPARLLLIALLSLVFKIIIQAGVTVPFIAKAAYTIRNYVIGFIHLILLGAVTAFILSMALHQRILPYQSPILRWGITCLFAGFILSEGLLFLQGTMLWAAKGFLPFYYEWLFATSALMPVGAMGVLMGSMWKGKDLESQWQFSIRKK